jgi:hypothetical protein
MKYIISSKINYTKLICDDAGPSYAKNFGWESVPISQWDTDDNVVIVDNRITSEECDHLKKIIDSKSECKFVFKIVDPLYDSAIWTNWYYDFLRQIAKNEKVAFLSVYQPAEWVSDLAKYVGGDRVYVLPYPYIKSKEISGLELSNRRNKIILTGARHKDIYPLRERMWKARKLSPVFRFICDGLEHPGYSDLGDNVSTGVIGKNYINLISNYRWMFLCPSRVQIELMKYLECAYAGCAPVGGIPYGLPKEAKDAFVQFPSGLGWTIKLAHLISSEDSERRSYLYRTVMRNLRDPQTMNNEFLRWVDWVFV